MKQSWRMARLAGVDINIHWSFSFVILWVLVQGYHENRSLQNTALILAAVLLIFVCVMLHEAGHAAMALGLNVDVKRIVLLPIGGLAQIQSVPDRPAHELLIAIAGPLVNLALVIGLLPLLAILGGPVLLRDIVIAPTVVVDDTIILFFQQNDFSGLILLLMVANAILFAFNLIPAFPMDGGRILRAGLSLTVSHRRATQLAMAIGVILAGVLMALAFQWDSPGLGLVSLFIFVAARPPQ